MVEIDVSRLQREMFKHIMPELGRKLGIEGFSVYRIKADDHGSSAGHVSNTSLTLLDTSRIILMSNMEKAELICQQDNSLRTYNRPTYSVGPTQYQPT